MTRYSMFAFALVLTVGLAASRVAANSGIQQLIVFNTPVSADEPGPALPGGAYEISFSADRGQSVSFATMMVQSNDRFFSPNEFGIALFDENGNPRTGDVTDSVFFLDADELDMRQRPANAFNIYVGTHGDAGAHHAHVILPGATYTEKSGTYVNAEGRVQMGQRAAFPPGEAKETWAIMRALSEVLGRRLPFDSLDAMRRQMYAEHEHLDMIDLLESPDPAGIRALAEREGGPLGTEPFRCAVDDFYLTNPIARASKVMAECSQMLGATFREAAE